MADELKNSRRARLIGIVLSAAWIALTGAYGLMQAGAKAHREAMRCYQMQAEAKAAPQCAAADAVLQNPLCGWKNASCSASALDYPKDLAYTAAIAFVPPALIWIFVFWRRRGQSGAVV
jgi:hypothetical protein